MDGFGDVTDVAGTGGHVGPSLRRGFVVEQAFQVTNEASVGAGFHAWPRATNYET